jgi:hypothetical protein
MRIVERSSKFGCAVHFYFFLDVDALLHVFVARPLVMKRAEFVTECGTCLRNSTSG